jgi:GNAT superfamily N-acetyltransferase
MGWDPPSKMEELFHCDSRFVIIRQRPQAQDRPDPDLPSAGEVPVMAYSMFRFDVEDDECVLYWYSWLAGFLRFHPLPEAHHFPLSSYELQVSRSAQRGGMGKALMRCLYEIARGWKMKKVMLTVFKGDDTWSFFFSRAFPPLTQRCHFAENHAAFLFYKAMGFVRLSLV